MQAMIDELASEDEEFVKYMKTSYGESYLKTMWFPIGNFFRDSYIGISISPEQVWYVD